MFKRSTVTGGSDSDANDLPPLFNICPDFPWKRLYMPYTTVMKRYMALRNYKPQFIERDYTLKHNSMPISQLKYQGQSILLAHSSSDWENYNEISDYFIEPSRAQAHHANQQSLIQLWKQNKSKIKQKAIIKYKNTSVFALREIIFSGMGYFEVGSFRPTNFAAMIEKYNMKDVLDISAGWGDRLIAARAKQICYTGVDPNTKNFPAYTEMIETLPSTGTSTMICSEFQSAVLPKLYDGIFTSPPYFNYEIYDKNIPLSSDVDVWFTEFLMFSLNKAWQVLKPGGHMIIVINDTPGTPPFISRMIDAVNKFSDVEYLGVISYAEVSSSIRNPQPMWIWRRCIVK